MRTTLYLVRQAALVGVSAAWQGSAAPHRPGQRTVELTRDLLAVRPIDACYFAPTVRSEQTAAHLAAAHGLQPLPLAALDEVAACHEGESVLVVAPRAVLAAYLAGVLGLTPEQADSLRLERCGISIVVHEHGRADVATLNASFHLCGSAA